MEALLLHAESFRALDVYKPLHDKKQVDTSQA